MIRTVSAVVGGGCGAGGSGNGGGAGGSGAGGHGGGTVVGGTVGVMAAADGAGGAAAAVDVGNLPVGGNDDGDEDSSDCAHNGDASEIASVGDGRTGCGSGTSGWSCRWRPIRSAAAAA